MRARSDEWARLAAVPCPLDVKAVVAGVPYTAITAPKIGRSAMGGNGLSFGECLAATLELGIQNPGEIPRMADIVIYARPKGAPDWLCFGTFYIDERDDSTPGMLNLTCYDAMLKTQAAAFTDEDESAFSWPMPFADAVALIAGRIGVTVDARTVLKTSSSYVVPFTNEKTMQEVLEGIGGALGGNWVITEAGALRLVEFAGKADTAAVGCGVVTGSMARTAPELTVTGVCMSGPDEAYTHGTADGYTLEIATDYASDHAADLLAVRVAGAVHTAYTVSGAIFDPAAELGDTIAFGTRLTGVIYSMNLVLGPVFAADVSAPGVSDLNHEYPYKSRTARALAKTVKTGASYHGVTISRANGIVAEKLVDGVTKASVTLNADKLAFLQGNDEVFYYDAAAGVWRLKSAVEIETVGADGSKSTLAQTVSGFHASVANLEGGVSELTLNAEGQALQIADANGKIVTIQQTINGITVKGTGGETLIDGGSIKTDNLYLNRLVSKTSVKSYIEMLENGLNFVLGNAETIGIGYTSDANPLPYMIFGAGSAGTGSGDGVVMVKKYGTGIWIGDAVDRFSTAPESGTGVFVDARGDAVYKYVNGVATAITDNTYLAGQMAAEKARVDAQIEAINPVAVFG